MIDFEAIFISIFAPKQNILKSNSMREKLLTIEVNNKWLDTYAGIFLTAQLRNVDDGSLYYK